MTHTNNFIEGFKAGLKCKLWGRIALGARATNEEFRNGRDAGFRHFRKLVNNAIANDRFQDIHVIVAEVIGHIDAGDTSALNA